MKNCYGILILGLFLGLFLSVGPALAFDPSTGDLAKDDSTDVRVMTYNTYRNFIADSSTNSNYERILQALDPDIIVFEEIYYTVEIDDIESWLDNRLGGTWTAWTGKYSGYYDGGSYVLDVCNAVASRWPLSLERWDTSPAASTRGVTMALVDLPDETYRRDMYVMGNHFKSNRDGEGYEERQESADAIAAWMGDARDAPEAENDYISLEAKTPMVVLGDFNFLSESQAAITLRTGDIQDTYRYGPAVKGDWDDTDIVDLDPVDPWDGYNDDTWPSYSNPYQRFDRIYYTDSVLMVANSFILNTRDMNSSQRNNAGLLSDDMEDASDHLPVVVDFRLSIPASPTPTPAMGRTPVPTPSAINLLSNPDFENWGPTDPTNWSVEQYSAVDPETTIVHGSNTSARLYTTGTTGSYGRGLYQSYYTVSPGDRFRFSAWLWSDQTASLGVNGYWWTGSTQYWDTVKSTTASGWEKVEVLTGPAPSGVSNLRVLIRGFLDYSQCGYVDDAELVLLGAATPTPIPPSPTPTAAPNLIVNGGFEQWEDVNTLVTWDRESYSLTDQDYNIVFEGSYSLELVSNDLPPVYGSGVYQDVSVSAGESYTFSARVNSSTSESIGIVLSWWDGSSHFQDTVKNNGIVGWEKLAWSGTAPAGTTSARLYVRGFADTESCGFADGARFWTYEITPIPTPPPTPYYSPSPTPTIKPTPSPRPTVRAVVGDYDGDFTSDLAVYRPSSGLWLVRGLTRIYFGTSSDEPVPQDYDGNGAWDYAFYRPSAGLWKVRDLTRIYFGGSDDICLPADYDGDSTANFAYFRPALSLWKIKDLTRIYFGASSDTPLPADYNGDGITNPAYFRPSNGLWKVLDQTRIYFGESDDLFIPADFDGDQAADFAYYRPTSGLWKVRDLTRIYFGTSEDIPIPADYDGDGTSDYGYFRPSSILWKVKDVTRVYFGLSDDTQVTNPY